MSVFLDSVRIDFLSVPELKLVFESHRKRNIILSGHDAVVHARCSNFTFNGFLSSQVESVAISDRDFEEKKRELEIIRDRFKEDVNAIHSTCPTKTSNRSAPASRNAAMQTPTGR